MPSDVNSVTKGTTVGLFQTLVDALAFGGIYALLSVGFSIILRATKVAQFGAGALAFVGAVTYVTLSEIVPAVLALVIVAAVGALSGLLLYLVLIRFGTILGGTTTSISLAALAAGILISAVIDLITGGTYQQSAPMVSGYFEVQGTPVLWQSLVTIGIAAVVLAAVFAIVSRSILGKAMTAVAQAPDVARALGIRSGRVLATAWIIGTAVMAIAGALITPIVAISSAESLSLALFGFTGAIIGGIDRPARAALGAVVLSLISTPFTRYINSELTDLVVFVALFLVLSIRPEGIFPTRKRRAA